MRLEKNNKKRPRGFSLLIVVIIMALLALVGTVVLSVVNTEQQIIGLVRLSKEARFGAESAAREVLNDEDLPSMLPAYSTPDLVSTYVKSPGSRFDRAATLGLSELSYEAEIALVRDVPIRESSLSVTRAFLYEVRVESEVAGGAGSDEVTAEVFKVFTVPAGTVLPDTHAR